jgi:hypothetical protein
LGLFDLYLTVRIAYLRSYNADSVNAPGTVSPSVKHPQKPHFSRFELIPHTVANGIVRGKSYCATDFNGFNRKRGDVRVLKIKLTLSIVFAL